MPVYLNIMSTTPAIEDSARWLASTFPALYAAVAHFFGVVIGLSIPLSVFFLIAIIYCVEQLKVIRKKEAKIHDIHVEPAYDAVDKPDVGLSNRWSSVQTHIESPNENDWRQAILEADIILDDILTQMGYRGENVGDKLKRVGPGEMKTLEDAWEAHKVRNDIAHKGSAFPLNQHEAKRVVNLYKKVFEEFYYI